MKEIYGNLWNVACDLRVISTNGMIRKDGACVMGRGCAYEAKKRFPGIEFRLGELLREHGNRVMRLGRYGEGETRTMICSFPVKHHWRQEASPVLIRRSAEQLVAVADKFGHERVIIPRPGCGNGKLSWDDVRPILAELLDDRFSVITFPPRSGKESQKSGLYNVVRETQRSFKTGDVSRTVIQQDVDYETALAVSEKEDRLAKESGALAAHLPEPV